ncbi:hypothetical protein QE422_003338 [Chryseobacterium sp. SORGH_AS 447]|nr:hypothetical protein [Chryseobacterium sp. SORGH_AS_0447]
MSSNEKTRRPLSNIHRGQQYPEKSMIEANPALHSGLYVCDTEKALEVIVESCIKN